MTTKRTQDSPSLLTYSIAAQIRAAMASHTPALKQIDIEQMTGLTQSNISRIIRPLKQMTLEELDAICRAVGLDPIEVMEKAQHAVREQSAARGRSWRDDLADDIRKALVRTGISHLDVPHVAGSTVLRARKGDPTVDESTLTLIVKGLGLEPVQAYKGRYAVAGAVEETDAPGARRSNAS